MTRPASFETVRLVPGQYAAGRIYYCRHLTPELVWRDEWLTHPNGVSSIAELTVISPAPEATRAAYAKLDDTQAVSGDADAFALRFETRDQVDARFGSLAAYLPVRPEMFAAITFRAPDLDAIAACAKAAGLPFERFGADSVAPTQGVTAAQDRTATLERARIAVALPAFATLLEFIG